MNFLKNLIQFELYEVREQLFHNYLIRSKDNYAIQSTAIKFQSSKGQQVINCANKKFKNSINFKFQQKKNWKK